MSLFWRKKANRYVAGKWEELYKEKVLTNEYIKENYGITAIEKVVSLFFLVYTHSNYEKVMEYLLCNDIEGVFNIIRNTPVDFDEIDYSTVRAFEIKIKDDLFIFLFKEDEDYRKMEFLNKLALRTSIIDKFDTARRIL